MSHDNGALDCLDLLFSFVTKKQHRKHIFSIYNPESITSIVIIDIGIFTNCILSKKLNFTESLTLVILELLLRSSRQSVDTSVADRGMFIASNYNFRS